MIWWKFENFVMHLIVTLSLLIDIRNRATLVSLILFTGLKFETDDFLILFIASALWYHLEVWLVGWDCCSLLVVAIAN